MTTSPRVFGLAFWLITLATLVGMLVTAALGRWQLSRGAEKEAYQSALQARSAQGAVDAAALLAERARDGARLSDHPLVHRAVVLQGQWLAAHTIYLDNRQMQGRPGFYVVTPLRVSPDGTAVLVQRGWVPRNFQDRMQLPEVQTPGGTVRVEGRVAAAPARLYEFQGGDSAQGSSRIRQNLDIPAFGAETGLSLSGLTVMQTGAPGEGLLRDWPVVGAGVDKHYGYAFQWFGLCGLIALLYVWFQIVRRFFRPRSQPAP